MKSFKGILATIGFVAFAALPATAFAASGTSTTTVSIAVAEDAKISVCGATTSLTSSGSFGNYTGNCQVTFSLRTKKTGGSGSITLAATSNWAAAGGGSGPVVGTDSFTYATSANTGPGSTNNGSIDAVSVEKNVITGIGANAHATNATFTSSFTLVDNPAWETDSYTVPIRYTVNAN